jgi:hypothetical protein
MAKIPKKKRGRPRKAMIVIQLSDVQPEWEARLGRMSHHKVTSPSNEVLEGDIPAARLDNWGRSIRPTKVILGESVNHRSVTQQTDHRASRLLEDAANAGIVLSSEWRRYLEYMYVIAEARSPNDNGAELKKLFLEDGRTQAHVKPPTFPEGLGTPVEFRERVRTHELELRYTIDRRKHAIRISETLLPPDEDEYLDPSGDPEGHWEGLKWIPTPPR